MPYENSLNAGLLTADEEHQLQAQYAGQADPKLDESLKALVDSVQRHKELRRVKDQVESDGKIDQEVALEAYQAHPNAIPYQPNQYTRQASHVHLVASLESMTGALLTQKSELLEQANQLLTKSLPLALGDDDLRDRTFALLGELDRTSERLEGEDALSAQAAERYVEHLESVTPMVKSLMLDPAYATQVSTRVSALAQALVDQTDVLIGKAVRSELDNDDPNLPTLVPVDLTPLAKQIQVLEGSLELASGELDLDAFTLDYANARLAIHDQLVLVHHRVRDALLLLGGLSHTVETLKAVGTAYASPEDTGAGLEQIDEFATGVVGLYECAQGLKAVFLPIVHALEVATKEANR